MVVTIGVSMATRPKPVAELNGLVYGATEIPKEAHASLFQRPAFWAAVVGIVFVVLNVIFR